MCYLGTIGLSLIKSSSDFLVLIILFISLAALQWNPACAHGTHDLDEP